jgi:hypothetical protein
MWALVACAGAADKTTGCAPNGQQACMAGKSAGYQVCGAEGEWDACVAYTSTAELASHPGESVCAIEPGLYSEHATASDVETVANCRSESTATLDWTGPDLAVLGRSAACNLGVSTTPDRCSRLCKYALDGGGTAEELFEVESPTTLSGHLTVTASDGRVCEYDLAITKN